MPKPSSRISRYGSVLVGVQISTCEASAAMLLSTKSATAAGSEYPMDRVDSIRFLASGISSTSFINSPSKVGTAPVFVLTNTAFLLNAVDSFGSFAALDSLLRELPQKLGLLLRGKAQKALNQLVGILHFGHL